MLLYYQKSRRKLNDDMNTQHYIPSKTHTTGFTIVELLIVIVVIAILAAISVVAYTGIQARADTSTKRADVASIAKAVAAAAVTDETSGTRFISGNSASANTAALNQMGLGQYADRAVPDAGLPLNDNSCTTPSGGMTKKKYCMNIGISGNRADGWIIWWNAQEKQWFQTNVSNGATANEFAIGDGDYPPAMVY